MARKSSCEFLSEGVPFKNIILGVLYKAKAKLSKKYV
jgi:hypothetical protein